MNANALPTDTPSTTVGRRCRVLAARLEPFDSYWQAPKDIDRGFVSFAAYYRANYLQRMPEDRTSRVLVVSCGPGYLVKMLRDAGYDQVIGIDSDAAKIAHAVKRELPCQAATAFEFLAQCSAEFDVIIPEQELNHLTLDETLEFLGLCRKALKPGGKIIVYAMNGANPLVGSENLSHNIDHFYNLTDNSFEQVMTLAGYEGIRVFPLRLYVFWKNPLNYAGLLVTSVLELALRLIFVLYGKKVKVLSKKIAAEAVRPAV
jgi:SAM-dependent methyltransferase